MHKKRRWVGCDQAGTQQKKPIEGGKRKKNKRDVGHWASKSEREGGANGQSKNATCALAGREKGYD